MVLNRGKKTLDAASQKKILGYFIEEANEHLVTLEQGILQLSSVVDDEERVNEMFRAAHSIKGGAAMLGYTSIQQISHRLEDAFKVLQEDNIVVDQKLEGLFLEGYDVLQVLVEHLQSPDGLEETKAEEIVQKAEPTFSELQNYLDQSLKGGVQASSTQADTTSAKVSQQAKEKLKQMLAIFRQQATPENRRQLVEMAESLMPIAPQHSGWQNLVATAATAIANPKHSYRLLAPVIITEIKQGSDSLELGQEQIAPSESLQKLANAKLPQILVSLEPEAAAKTLKQAFNQQQLAKIVELIQN